MKRLGQIIRFLYLGLFFLTPLIFNFRNSELFELPKMHFVYFLTIIIVSLHFINWLSGQTKLVVKHPLSLPLLLFLISQIITTFTSIDPNTSFFGYYSRLNGGLLSIITFTSLFYYLIPYLTPHFQKNIINISLFSGFLVAVYGILQHLGIDRHLWVQDVQNRVFSSLGQPNWLAAYLCIIIPFSLYQSRQTQNPKISLLHHLNSLALFACLLFTKSKSGLIAAGISLGIYFLFQFIFDFKHKTLSKNLKLYFLPILFLVIALTTKNPLTEKIFPKKSSSAPAAPSTNLIITPSADIRRIVWRGSLDLWQKFPLFGTGVETFAYSYYWTRPVEHNLTSEWDFLYNKAHNEYLNYLATTGLVGFVPYIFLIITFLVVLFKNRRSKLFLPVLSAYLSILITNAAGFSVVVTSLYFFLLPALFFFSPAKPAPPSAPKPKYFMIIPISIGLFLTYLNFTFYLADIYYAKSESADSRQNYPDAYKYINLSLKLNPYQPTYLITHALASAKMALATKDQSYIKIATTSADRSVAISPANINFWRQRAQVYYYLSGFGSDYFIKTVESMIQASKLAPTDPKNYYSLAQFLESAQLIDDAIFYYQQAIKLKPNYDHAYFSLGKIYFDKKDYRLATDNLQQAVNYSHPVNTEAQKLLDQIKTSSKP